MEDFNRPTEIFNCRCVLPEQFEFKTFSDTPCPLILLMLLQYGKN